MNKIELARKATELVVGLSTSAVVGQVIKNNYAATTLPQKGAVVVTSFVVGGLVSKAAQKHADEEITKLVAAIENIRSQAAEAK